MAAGNEIVIDKKKSGLILPGAVISCTTNLGDKIRGEVIGYDEDAKAVIISIFSIISFYLAIDLFTFLVLIGHLSPKT